MFVLPDKTKQKSGKPISNSLRNTIRTRIQKEG